MAYRLGGIVSKSRVLKALLFLVMLCSHLFVVILLFNTRSQIPPADPTLIFQYVQVVPPKPGYPEPVVNISVRPVNPTLFLPPDVLVIEVAEQAPALMPLVEAESGATIFDPRLREKLNQARKPEGVSEFENGEHWEGADGRTYVYVGNGECMVSMAKMNWRERGAQWSATRVPCGKNDSEKMMDRVMADFESRKARK